MNEKQFPAKFSWGWAFAQFPAVALAFPHYADHKVEVGVGLSIWVLVTAFLTKVWKELEEDAVKGLADLVRQAPNKARQIASRSWDWLIAVFSSWSPGYRTRYLNEVKYRYGRFNDKGLGLINANRLALKDVYIDLEIEPDPMMKSSSNDLLARDYRQPRPIWSYLNHSQIDKPIAIIGPPGTGKTTLVHHLLLAYAQNTQRAYRATARLPLYFEIRTFPDQVGIDKLAKLGEAGGQARAHNFPRLVQVMAKLLEAAYPDLKRPPAGWLERHLRQGKAIILLDGLDEVSNESVRKGLSSWLDEELESIDVRRCPVVVTARPGGYRSAPLSRAIVAGLKPFTREQAGRFIYRWYLANEAVSRGNIEASKVKREATEGAMRLLDALRGAPQLYELTSNPLLLTMVCMVHRYRGTLPGSRVQLYSEICQVLLERWRQVRGLTDDFRVEQKLMVLRPLAAHMMDIGVRELSDNDARQLISPILERFNLTDEQSQRFLSKIQEDSGLLLEKEPGKWGFAHLSFQEYLTASHWRADGAPTFTRDLILRPWWREVLLLYAPYEDATPIIEAALSAGTPAAIALALDIDKEALSVEKATKQKLDIIWRRVLENPADVRFPIAAEALLVSNANRDYKTLDEEVQIRSPVCQAEYQLFLMDSAKTVSIENREMFQCMCRPQHWSNFEYSGSPTSPIVGLLPWQRFAFARWMTYRFPTFIHMPAAAGEWRQSLDFNPSKDRLASAEQNEQWRVGSLALRHACQAIADRLTSADLIRSERRDEFVEILQFSFRFTTGAGIDYPSLDVGLQQRHRATPNIRGNRSDWYVIQIGLDDAIVKEIRATLLWLVDKLDQDVNQHYSTEFVKSVPHWELRRTGDDVNDIIAEVLADKRRRVTAGVKRLQEFFSMPKRVRQAQFVLRTISFAESFFGAHPTNVQADCRRWLGQLLEIEEIGGMESGPRIFDFLFNTAEVRQTLSKVHRMISSLNEIEAKRAITETVPLPLELSQPLRTTRLHL